jgi:hypothetical protein
VERNANVLRVAPPPWKQGADPPETARETRRVRRSRAGGSARAAAAGWGAHAAVLRTRHSALRDAGGSGERNAEAWRAGRWLA